MWDISFLPFIMPCRDVQNLLDLCEVEGEKDLGIFTTKYLKFDRQCASAFAKAMSLIGLIKRYSMNIDIINFRQLYETYIRPHLEHCVQACSPYLMKDMACLENFQRGL